MGPWRLWLYWYRSEDPLVADRIPEAGVGYLDHEVVGTVDLSSHRDHAIIAPFEGVHDRVANRLSHRKLDVVAISAGGPCVISHPPAGLSDAARPGAGLQAR